MSRKGFNDLPDNIQTRRIFQQLEHDIKTINRQKINEITGDVSKDSLNNVVTTVAILRAKYLEKVLLLECNKSIAPSDISSLRTARIMYEEAREAFSALQYALRQDYFTLKD